MVTGTPVEQLIALGQILIALGLGAAIGFEREWRNKPAGFRTHAFVAAACTSFIVIAPHMVSFIGAEFPKEALRVEPLSLVHGIILGVGFIAGSVALKDAKMKQVHNLTTAATILCACVVGIAVGSNLYIVALGLSAIVIAGNLIRWPFEQ